MTRDRRALGIAVFASALFSSLGCNGPTGLLPGGALQGDALPAPSDWDFAGDQGTAQLETKPAEPYSVNLAYTILNGLLYVNAGNTETQWVQNMTANPLVRLRIAGAIYELRAERVTDSAEIEAFGEAWTGQSFFRRDPRDYEEVWIYRLVARS